MQQYKDNKLQNFVTMANKEHKNTSQSQRSKSLTKNLLAIDTNKAE